MSAPIPDPTKPHEQQDPIVLLGMVVWAEARGESSAGRDAVAHVPLNRVALAPRFGADLVGVIMHPWAFSCLNRYHQIDGSYLDDPNRAKMLRPLAYGTVAEWEDSYRAAQQAMAGITTDPTNGATHYVTVDLWRRPCPGGRDPKWFEAPEVDAGHTIEMARIDNMVYAKAA